MPLFYASALERGEFTLGTRRADSKAIDVGTAGLLVLIFSSAGNAIYNNDISQYNGRATAHLIK